MRNADPRTIEGALAAHTDGQVRLHRAGAGLSAHGRLRQDEVDLVQADEPRYEAGKQRPWEHWTWKRVARLNTGGSLEAFRAQLLDLVANVLNSYWDLVSAGDEWKARQRAEENAQKFYQDTQKEIAAGPIPRVELSRAA